MAFVIGKYDEAKKEEGIWTQYGGSDFLIGYTGTKFTKTLNRLRKPHEKAIQRNTVDPDTLSGLYQKAIVETVLLDWKNVTDFEGNDVPYSKEMAIEALKSDPDFFTFVTEFSTEITNFEKEAKEAKVKKS